MYLFKQVKVYNRKTKIKAFIFVRKKTILFGCSTLSGHWEKKITTQPYFLPSIEFSKYIQSLTNCSRTNKHVAG